MAEAHVGIGSTPRRINQCYAGIGGGARLVREIYAGINGAVRLAWTFGINRLYFASYLGVGECDIATFAIIKPANDIAYMIGGMGGIRRRLWAFDNRNSTNTALNDTRMLELDVESRAIIQASVERNSYLQWSQLGGTVNRLYRAHNRIAGYFAEIDPDTLATIRSATAIQYGGGESGMACTSSRVLTFNHYGASSQDIMYERDPATLGVIRQIASISRFNRHTGIDEQIFSSNQSGVSYTMNKINQIDVETLAIIRSSPYMDSSQSIGGTKS